MSPALPQCRDAAARATRVIPSKRAKPPSTWQSNMHHWRTRGIPQEQADHLAVAVRAHGADLQARALIEGLLSAHSPHLDQVVDLRPPSHSHAIPAPNPRSPCLHVESLLRLHGLLQRVAAVLSDYGALQPLPAC